MTNGFLEASFVYQKLTIRLFPKMYKVMLEWEWRKANKNY